MYFLNTFLLNMNVFIFIYIEVKVGNYGYRFAKFGSRKDEGTFRY
ncbi:hypothetical protein ES705_08226 [subsurface metagenome]